MFVNALTFVLTDDVGAYLNAHRADAEQLVAELRMHRGVLRYCTVRNARHGTAGMIEVAHGDYVTPPLSKLEAIAYILRKFW